MIIKLLGDGGAETAIPEFIYKMKDGRKIIVTKNNAIDKVKQGATEFKNSKEDSWTIFDWAKFFVIITQKLPSIVTSNFIEEQTGVSMEKVKELDRMGTAKIMKFNENVIKGGLNVLENWDSYLKWGLIAISGVAAVYVISKFT
ncbi:MAG: hypothetical protein EHM58_04485 [Ignavibacteriae bacterium]|nr:MAG: hypothetical protein EHM58_04485 [Ignavibacteriota bacterium]